MTEILTAAQMRSIEKTAIESGQVSGLELMERAGRGVVEAILKARPDLAEPRSGDGAAPARRAVVLCGPGNNGGDGFVIARLLKDLGWDVAVFFHGDTQKLPRDALTNYERWSDIGQVGEMLGEGGATQADVVIDAVFGTGLTREISEELCAAMCRRVPEGRPYVVAVDIPSGLSSDSGRVLGRGPLADLTVTFHRAKLGHYLGQGPELCGTTVVADIGLDADQPQPERVRLVGAPGPLDKAALGHKFAHGSALVVSGGTGRSGAARLSARGALRVGAGLVTLAVPPSAWDEVAVQITALMMRKVAEAEDLREVLADARFNALCIGPGLGLQPQHQALVGAALKSNRPTVLDADALTLIANEETLFDALHAGCVLTPHGGEFRRLFKDLEGAVSKVEAAREAAARAGCVVVFKGADTVIASPDGRCALHSAAYERAAPWLATAGSGDVLAGFVTGLMARGLDPFEAAKTGVWLHVECARSFGPGLIAEDIPEEIPRLFSRLIGVESENFA